MVGSRALSPMLVAALLLPGCSSLEFRDDDSVPETAGKVVLAIPVAIGSILFCGFASDVERRGETLALDDELGIHDRVRERDLRELR